MVRVTVSETYDLSTKTGKMSMIGIHTPSTAILRKSYPGLMVNSKFVKFVKADVRLACASSLPADPLQIGVESGDIAPQDMFNPILYKAVSNQAMNTFENRMHGMDTDNTDIIRGQSLAKTDKITTATDDYDIYYSLLGNRKGWKVAHPQRGLTMASLRPLVYEKYYNVGDSPNSTTSDSYYDIGLNDAGTDYGKEVGNVLAMRGKPHRLPAIPTAVLNASGVATYETDFGMYETSGARDMNVYVGLILLPPSRLMKWYYRLVIRWTIDFMGIRPINEVQNFSAMASNSPYFYGSDYFPISAKKEDLLGMVDVHDAEAEKVMEGA